MKNIYNIHLHDVEYYYYHDEEQTNPEKYKMYTDSCSKRLEILKRLEINDKLHDTNLSCYNVIVTDDVVLALSVANEKFSVDKEVNVSGNTTMHEAAKTVAVGDQKIAPSGVVYNELVEVHMPGQALANYNETLLVEDSCTDVLQGHLDSGWRIIACCPQPDKRRPDYIMGRFNPDREVHGRAKRYYS